MRCLRCAGAPRRPATGSALYLTDLSQHVVPYVPGEPLAACIQFLRVAHLPSPGTIRLGTPDVKQCRGLLIYHCYDLLGCLPPFSGDFYFRAFNGLVTLPVVGYNYGGNWTIPPAGLSPARSAASVAAPVPGFHCTFLPDMPPPETPGNSTSSVPGSEVGTNPCNPFPAGCQFRGFHGSLICYGLPVCLPPLHGSDRLPGRRGLLLLGFQRFGQAPSFWDPFGSATMYLSHAVVLCDVPSDSTAVGIPAVVKRRSKRGTDER
jgi:hypothetical protein